jgi:hypothetical protein
MTQRMDGNEHESQDELLDLEASLLYGISNVVNYVRDSYDYIAFAGTALSLANAQTIQSATGRDDDLDIVTNLPYHQPSDVKSELERFIHIPEGCTIEEANLQKLTGRPRLVCLTVHFLGMMTGTAEQKLNKAIEKAYDDTHRKIIDSISQVLLNTEMVIVKKFIALLTKVVIYNAVNEKLVLTVNKDSRLDIVNFGIFHIRRNESQSEWSIVPDEPLGNEVVRDIVSIFGKLDKKSVTAQLLQIMNSTSEESYKGTPMETIIMRSLLAPGKFTKLQPHARSKNDEDSTWISKLNFQEWVIVPEDGDDKLSEGNSAPSEDETLFESNLSFASVWVSIKLAGIKKPTRDTRISNSQVVPDHVCYSQKGNAPKPNMKYALLGYNQFILPHLDTKRQLFINVILSKANTDVLLTLEELERGQFLINVDCNNLDVLLDDNKFITTVKELENYPEQEITPELKAIANITEEEESSEIFELPNKRRKLDGNIEESIINIRDTTENEEIEFVYENFEDLLQTVATRFNMKNPEIFSIRNGVPHLIANRLAIVKRCATYYVREQGVGTFELESLETGTLCRVKLPIENFEKLSAIATEKVFVPPPHVFYSQDKVTQLTFVNEIIAGLPYYVAQVK